MSFIKYLRREIDYRYEFFFFFGFGLARVLSEHVASAQQAGVLTGARNTPGSEFVVCAGWLCPAGRVGRKNASGGLIGGGGENEGHLMVTSLD